MRSVLAINLSAIRELSLQSLSQDWIEWLILTSAYVYPTKSEGNYKLESLEVIFSLRSLAEVLGPE